MKKIIQNDKLMIFFIVFLMVFLCVIALLTPPMIIAFFVSLPILPKLTNNNDWIGFWGNYIGSFVGSIVPFIILYITLTNDKKKQKNMERIKCCEKLISDISILEGMGREVVGAIDLDYGSRDDQNFSNKCKEFWVKFNEIFLYYQCIMGHYSMEGVLDFEKTLLSYRKSVEDVMHNAKDEKYDKRKMNASVVNLVTNQEMLFRETRKFIWKYT